MHYNFRTGFLGFRDDEDFQNDYEYEGRNNNNYDTRNDFIERDPFMEMRSLNPFSIMRQFEKMMDEEPNFHNFHEATFYDRGRDDEDFSQDFFGARDDMSNPRSQRFRFERNEIDPFQNPFPHHQQHQNVAHNSPQQVITIS